ncbi:methylglyoxal reductase (NADPH-dependent) gre2 [Onygenales sp. PD_40]|nr:methylglyoxal reductase (NADPH-dependent) gre2 [Onygenales sp. PD_40]KAK2788738.1 methylglyoxal reductase (NADPH-dependent) gre2 [Onygenales sp. PD_12]
MTRTLLTGGSGFIAAHVLDSLLARGHSVVTTVRSEEKAQKIREAHPNVPKDKLDFAIVEDIAKLDAFDKAVISDPPFETVIHTASPFHMKAVDNRKELIDPAINGTLGILRAIKRSAPTVTRVVITSSFAAVINLTKPVSHTFSEADWNPITEAEADLNPANGYRASKTFAEKAAWEFLEKEKPNFTIATINPPVVIGPVVHYLASLSTINTSNERIRDLITGAARSKCPPTGMHFWVDVRDVALAHVLAAEVPEAAGKRFFITAGKFSNREMAEVIAQEFPELKGKVPEDEEALKSGDYPEGGFWGYDNSRSKNVLGLEYTPLRETVVDAVKSLKGLLAQE